MRYDPEYNSYRFSIEELINIVNSLTFYSLYSPCDDKTRKDIQNLLNQFKNLSDIPIG